MYNTLPIEIDYLTYKRILNAMCKIILKYILNRSEGFKMPYGLGFIQIGKYQPKTLTNKSLSVDYKSSKEYGKCIYHLNEHSDGYKYQLCLVRTNKRKLAQLIFNKQDYLNINDIQIYKM